MRSIAIHLDVAGCGFALLSQEVADALRPTNASAHPVTRKHWLPATRLPDHYRDRTLTG